MALAVKNPPASAGGVRDAGSIPGSGGSPGKGNGNPLHILTWKIPWTEEPGRLYSPWGCKESDATEQLRKASVLNKAHS